MASVSERPNTFFRLSPAEGKPECYALRRGEIEGRFSAEYYRAEFRDLISNLIRSYPEIHGLGSYAEVTCGPFGTAITLADYVSNGVPLLRISNITDEGTLDLSDVVFITPEKSAKLASTRVFSNDLVISQRGTLGMPAVVSDEYPVFNISANLISIRNAVGLKPRYIQLYLASKLGERQIARLQSGQVHAKITTDDVSSVLIPAVENQDELVAAMDAARAERRAKLAEADALLAGLDGYVLDTLSLSLPPKDERKVFATRRATVPARFDPHFHLPAFAQILRMLAVNGSEPLGSLVSFSKETWKPEQHDGEIFRYIEISGVNRETGEAAAVDTRVTDAPSRARMAVVDGDIIVSLTRPHHGSIAQITQELDGCVASTGFAVIRDVNEARLMSDYLWCILRTKMCLWQMLQRASGGNYPAITEPELAKVLIPVPDMGVQETIATEARRRREEARRLRAEAEADWQAAKHWFEEQLLGPVQP